MCQKELDDITRQLLSTEPDSVSSEIGRIRQFGTGQLGNIRQLLRNDLQKAKVEREKHVTEIRMYRKSKARSGTTCWTQLGGYGEKAGTSATERIRFGCGGRI